MYDKKCEKRLAVSYEQCHIYVSTIDTRTVHCMCIIMIMHTCIDHILHVHAYHSHVLARWYYDDHVHICTILLCPSS